MPGQEAVRVSTIADAAMAPAMRRVAMAVASSAGLTIDRVEDVALATGEAYGVLLAAGDIERVECAIDHGPGFLEVTMVAEARDPSASDTGGSEIDSLAGRILGATTDDFSFAQRPPRVAFTIRARSD